MGLHIYFILVWTNLMWNPLGLTSYPTKKRAIKEKSVTVTCQRNAEEAWLEGNPQLRRTVLFPRRCRGSGKSRCSAEQGERRSVFAWDEGQVTVCRNRRLRAAHYIQPTCLRALTATRTARCYCLSADMLQGHRCFWVGMSVNNHSGQPHLMLLIYSCYQQLRVQNCDSVNTYQRFHSICYWRYIGNSAQFQIPLTFLSGLPRFYCLEPQ